jgi:secreted trypsin-like serine protease
LFAVTVMAGIAAPAQAVYNGHPAPPNALPYAVRVDALYQEGFYVDFCTGSLIANYAVVTAAHCLHASGKTLLAVYVNFHVGQPGEYSVSVPLRGAHTKPEWVVGANKDDVAVLYLARSVTEPTVALATTPPAVGSPVVVAGYGCTSNPYPNTACPTPSKQLQEMATDVVASKSCPSISGVWGFCTYSPNMSINHGDSGGPVVQVRSGVIVLVGLTEGFEGKAKWKNFNTSVAYNLSWIKDTADL